MDWEKIFDGVVLGDHITVEWYVDDEDDSDYPVKVTATNKHPPVMMNPIVEPGCVTIPLPPDSPSSRYEFEYENIDDMYAKFAEDTGRTSEFTDALKKALGDI